MSARCVPWLVLTGCSETGLSGNPFAGLDPAAPSPVDVDVVDTFVQAPDPPVDVLWVVDNSCSMEEEQSAIAANFPAFSAWFAGSELDYHIGVVSTDMVDPGHSGRLQEAQGYRWIDAATPFADSVFDGMARLGTSGDSAEKGRAAAYTAIEIKKESDNAGFVRDDARLAIIVLSDEVDHSGDTPIGLDEWIAYLEDVKGTPSRVGVHSIVGPPGGCGVEAEEGSGYIEVTEAFDGVLVPICTEDWVSVLDEIGQTVASPVQEFFLTRLPVVGSIAVGAELDGAFRVFDPLSEWTYDASRNSVALMHVVVEPGTPVRVEYEALAPSERVE
jgi:hypothetical protein